MKGAICQAADVVASTYGPRGRVVLIGRPAPPQITTPHMSVVRTAVEDPYFTRDGVTVCRWLEGSDDIEQLGVSLLRMAAEDTLDKAGDGTTLTCILLSEIIRGFDRMEQEVTLEQMDMMSELSEEVIRRIEALATPTGFDELVKIVGVSVKSEDIARQLARGLWNIWPHGEVTFEYVSSLDNPYGVQFVEEKGHFYPLTIPTEFLGPSGEAVEYLRPWIAISEEHMDSVADINEIVKQSLDSGSPAIIIANSFSEGVLKHIEVLRKRHSVRLIPLQLPGSGAEGRKWAEDIRILLRTHKVASVRCTSRGYHIITEAPIPEKRSEYTTHLERLSQTADNVPSNEERKIMRQRLASFAGKRLSVLISEQHRASTGELADRIDDGVRAGLSALAGGSVPGGGMTLWRIGSELLKEDHVPIWQRILAEALCAPLRYLVANSEGQMREDLADQGWGYDAAAGQWRKELTDVIDPAWVLISAIRSSVAAGRNVLMTRYVVRYKGRSKTKEAACQLVAAPAI